MTQIIKSMLIILVVLGLTGCMNGEVKTEPVIVDEKPGVVTEPIEVVDEKPEVGTEPIVIDEPFFGDWMISQVQAAGIGTFSDEEAKSLVGKKLIYNSDSASFFGDNLTKIGDTVDNPLYTSTVYTESSFVEFYRIPLEHLGIESKEVTEIRVMSGEEYISTFFIKDENTLIIVGGGTYFEATRIPK